MSTIVRSATRPLASRSVRVRNACVRHAARQLGLPIPSNADLRSLADNVTLAHAIRWWTNTHGREDAVLADARPRFVVRTACVAAITLLALAFSYGSVQ